MLQPHQFDCRAPVYDRLGVHSIINCGGVRTVYGNSIVSDAVLGAMASAAGRYVLIEELAEAIGARIAQCTGAEWGIVTAGSAAALALASAACMAGNDPERMLRLPRTEGMRNVALVPGGHRFAYDHAIRSAGCRIVEIETTEEAEHALKQGNVALISVRRCAGKPARGAKGGRPAQRRRDRHRRGVNGEHRVLECRKSASLPA
jgi:seryl-tRNA(Sec) selenium transferase